MKAEGMPEQDDRPSVCQNCEAMHGGGYRFTLQPIDDIFQRVAAGEPMPAGQCENCGALCQLVTEQQESN